MIEAFPKTAERPVADRLFRKMCRMERILVPEVATDGFDQFVITKIVVFLNINAPTMKFTGVLGLEHLLLL